jgi:two-component system, NarL family, nitrate/nitrite response regulator NarL
LLYEHIFLADFQRLLASQIDGCIPISVSSDTLIGTLDMIATGDIRVMIAPYAKSPPIQPVQPDEPNQLEIKAETLQSDHAERRPVLSQREVQILDGLVKGYANKVIARRCDITDATVQVHMKSILRKIRVANGTQAAIWALENGHVAPNFTGPLSKLRSDQAAAAITAAAIGSIP